MLFLRSTGDPVRYSGLSEEPSECYTRWCRSMRVGNFIVCGQLTSKLINEVIIMQGVTDGWTVRTKPQAPRSLLQWLASSFEAGIGCESQEVNRRMLKQS
jgi:hypothetical protein